MGDFGNLPCVGVYADVIKPGRVRRGDAIRVLS
jgi:MOSC domain-containing protein YiiM